jgi:PEGA domain
MSAPVIEPLASSTSSSGHVDGLGRRSLSFDRTTGAVLERLHLRPELAVFEQTIRKRVERLSGLEEERFARPSNVERDPAAGELVVVAEFVAGSRMSELLETSSETSVVPGIDVALGYLLESLPALSFLHTAHRVTHGLIDPSRTVLTPEGQVVLLDVALGHAVERLHLSPQRLLRAFGVAPAPESGSPGFDPTADITQVALSALMLVLGRNLRREECPQAVPSLLMEVIEVAQIRGSAGFAAGLQQFFQRSLPLPGRRAYTTADEAIVDVRQLVRREIGVEVCRQAMIDFVEHMEAAFPTAPTYESPCDAPNGIAPELDSFLDDFEPRTHAITSSETEDGLEDAVEVELSLDQLDPTASVQERPAAEQVYDLPSLETLDLSAVESDLLPSIRATHEEARVERWRALDTPVPAPALAPEPAYEPLPPPEPEPLAAPVAETHQRESAPIAHREPEPPPPMQPEIVPVPEPERPAPEVIAAAPVDTPVPDPVSAEPPPIETLEASVTTAEPAEPESERDSGSSRRKKRHQQKSARARKDKLRSTTAIPKMPPPPGEIPAAARHASASGWLVSPQRSAAFEPPVPVQPPQPQPPRPVQVPAVPSFTPTVVGPLPQPAYAAPAQNPVYGTPSATPASPPGPLTPVATPPPSPSIQLKPKSNPPIGFSPPRKPAPIEPAPISILPERVGTMAPLTLGQPPEDAERRAFPWKLAAVAVFVAVVAIIAGRSYLPGRTAVAGEPGAPVHATQAGPAQPDSPDTPIPSGRGRLSIVTQPPGVRVLMDGKPIGETPLKVDALPGRRVLSFLTSGGEIIRSTRVTAGKTTTLDLPVFSGWVAVFAPIVLDVSEDGRSIGSTDQNRLLLPPGRHELTLSNKELGYSSVHTVDIEPGGVKSINVDPRGTASLNASPWAEVWLDGLKLGETPLTSQVPIGVREFVFKHPTHGEKRASGTIRANGTTHVSVDFDK